MQEKSALNFPFNTQVQEKSVENSSWIAVKALIGRRVRVASGKGGAGDILQSDISHLQLNTLLGEWRGFAVRIQVHSNYGHDCVPIPDVGVPK